MRKTGLLMPVSSFPSKYGIGDFGKQAFEFIDIMQSSGSKVWQILPLNPLGYGNSPYQPYSSYALDELFISIEKLVEMGLLSDPTEFGVIEDSSSVNFEQARELKTKYFKQAFDAFKFSYSNYSEEFQKFKEDNSWVDDYALFITFKKKHDMKCWIDWDREFKYYPKRRKLDLEPYQDDLLYEEFIQFLLYNQWNELRCYANSKDIEIMGDIPIYVSIDSQDVWANPKYFKLDRKANPKYIAGVPPDYFSETGQRWGNPIYDWKKIQKDNFSFWVDRMLANSKLFDIVRVDHFRAFYDFWQIKASCETAIDGKWLLAPGKELFETLYNEIEDLNIVVEDLGDLSKGVHVLRDHFNLKGMKIVQFTFDPNETNNDFDDRENMIIYTGTHDNSTILGWFNEQDEETKQSTMDFLKIKKESDFVDAIIEYTLSSIADLAVIPVWDLLELDDESRFNTPGTVGSPNWEWKLTELESTKSLVKKIKKLNKKTNR